MNRNPLIFRTLAAVALAGVGCRDASSPTPTAPTAAASLSGIAQGLQAPDPAALASAIPGFGGFYLDAGVPTVYLLDPAARGAAERALGAYAAGRGFTPAQIRVLPGQFGYQELDRWFRQISREAFVIGGVVFTDLDEASNRVLVGVEHGAAAASVRGLAARLGIPSEALTVRETEPIHFVQTLRDKIRPVVGGVQIRFSGFLCSLSFNAVRSGTSGFVTASHCSDTQGAVDGTLYYQPLNQVPAEFIGTEIADPSFFRNSQGCPNGRKCRRSDANFSQGASGVMFALGGIAKTTGVNTGSLDISGSFTITAELSGNATVGQRLDKVGRTTGWTEGTVTNSCVNVGVSGSNVVLLCQDIVQNSVQIVGAGDSGSPVFFISGGNNVTLHGTLWGGNSSGTLLVYSPITNIEQELGALTTH
jgi:hypothetical protein